MIRIGFFYGACDPSLGKAGNSRDPSALCIGGYNRRTGVLDVVEALIKKRLPDKIISDIIELQRRYRCVLWGIETVQFQEFLRLSWSNAARLPVSRFRHAVSSRVRTSCSVLKACSRICKTAKSVCTPAKAR